MIGSLSEEHEGVEVELEGRSILRRPYHHVRWDPGTIDRLTGPVV